MLPSAWITTHQLAARAGISVQAARSLVRAALAGTPWRGAKLQVRRRLGRGGRGGLVYEVALASLPAELVSSPDSVVSEPAQAPPRRATIQDAQILSRLEIITPILRTQAASAARSEAILYASATSEVSARTVYRWLRLYEDQGVRGLARVRPSNAGQRRVLVSRPFDRVWRASGLSDASLEEIGAELATGLKSLWASRAEQAGSAEVRRLAEFLLQEICERRQVTLPRDAFRLSRRGVERFAHYRAVNQRRNDRKAFDDAKPRIRRDWTGLLPMERVVADVKHLDVIVRRQDGSPAWPKIIAFMDAGTGRVFVHLVLLEPREGVRQEHVIEAFLAMVATPSWGFPQGLYLDNGSEFAALQKIDHALQLLGEPGARTLIFARPYNASAKPIESLFARLDRQLFCLLPGYAGPNRMAKKTQTVGKPPLPYPGDWEDFGSTVQGLVRAHNHRPVGGAWANRSPEDWLQQKVEDGWRPAHVDPAALDAAFADPDNRRVDRGVLKIQGQRYTHERLAALPSRTSVDLALPWRRGARPLAKLGEVWVYLEPETLYPARWIEGARESSRRQKAQVRHVAGLAQEAPPIDPVALKIRWGERQAGIPSVKPLPPLDLGERPNAQARVMGATKGAVGPSAPELRRAREMAITERLERTQRRHD